MLAPNSQLLKGTCAHKIYCIVSGDTAMRKVSFLLLAGIIMLSSCSSYSADRSNKASSYLELNYQEILSSIDSQVNQYCQLSEKEMLDVEERSCLELASEGGTIAAFYFNNIPIHYAVSLFYNWGNVTMLYYQLDDTCTYVQIVESWYTLYEFQPGDRYDIKKYRLYDFVLSANTVYLLDTQNQKISSVDTSNLLYGIPSFGELDKIWQEYSLAK